MIHTHHSHLVFLWRRVRGAPHRQICRDHFRPKIQAAANNLLRVVHRPFCLHIPRPPSFNPRRQFDLNLKLRSSNVWIWFPSNDRMLAAVSDFATYHHIPTHFSNIKTEISQSRKPFPTLFTQILVRPVDHMPRSQRGIDEGVGKLICTIINNSLKLLRFPPKFVQKISRRANRQGFMRQIGIHEWLLGQCHKWYYRLMGTYPHSQWTTLWKTL